MSAIGIDLGTTFSCVAVVKDGKPETIISTDGKRTTPSVIGLWHPNEIYIGESPYKSIFKYPNSIVTGVKYNIGKKYSNKNIVKSAMLINVGETIKYNIKRGDTYIQYAPEELSAMVLKKLKLNAEDSLGKDEIKKAVITVPTYFGDLQREATIAAGKIAGFEEIKLINESVAAAVAYGVEHKLSDNKIIFVFDFGGGTLDVSILKFHNNEFNVLAIDGDLHLGGDDITNILVEHILDEVGRNISTSCNRYRLKLFQICEEAKIFLSNQNVWNIDVTGAENLEITTKTFIELTNDLFDKVMSIVKKCLNNCKLNINDIDDIVLVGGSSRIPTIQNRLMEFFDKKLRKNINPDEAVAQGAAIVAANWDKSGFEYIKLNTMIAHSIGVELLGKDMFTIIPRYSKLPIQRSDTHFCPEKEDETDVILEVFSGEDILTKNNTYLGSLNVFNIAIEPTSNMRYFTITLKITDNGILKVSTIDNSKKSNNTTIILDKSSISENDIKYGFIRLNTQQIK